MICFPCQDLNYIKQSKQFCTDLTLCVLNHQGCIYLKTAFSKILNQFKTRRNATEIFLGTGESLTSKSIRRAEKLININLHSDSIIECIDQCTRLIIKFTICEDGPNHVLKFISADYKHFIRGNAEL